MEIIRILDFNFFQIKYVDYYQKVLLKRNFDSNDTIQETDIKYNAIFDGDFKKAV